ncbi:hypothetical protein [Pseudomonas sp.]|uniref:hypothetical protein n=1 Tax=Pseudomonas sp. TaxID=306 RepID=UPI003D0FA6F8
MKRLIGVAGLLALVAAGSAWVRDEPLSTEVQQWQQQIQVATGESRAYLYLSGLDAPLDQQPDALGAARLQDYERWFAGRGVTDADYTAPTVDRLPVPEGPLFCQIETPGCFEKLLAQAAQLPDINLAQSILRARYMHFLDLEDYRTLTSVSIAEPVPRLTYMYKGQQLFDLFVLQLALDGQGNLARSGLHWELSQLREQLIRADNLVLKMLLGVLVNRNLEWQVRLYRNGLIPPPVMPSPFSEEERSLLKPMQREFFGIAQMYAQLQDSVSGTEYLNLLLWFRPQMTINASLTPYSQAAALSRLEPQAFAAAMEAPAATPFAVGGLRNRAGNILLAVAGPDMRLYAGRLQDLEAKRRLLAVLVQLPQGALDEQRLARLPEARNPYYPTRSAKPDGQGQLCFDGPQEAAFNGRCMPL